MLASLYVILVCEKSFFLYFTNLAAHLNDAVLGKQDLLSHYVDLSFQVLIAPNCVIQADFFIGQEMENVTTLDLLLMEIFFRRDHLLNFIFLFIELYLHLLALVLQDQVTPTKIYIISV
jgi:hypothetical protein